MVRLTLSKGEDSRQRGTEINLPHGSILEFEQLIGVLLQIGH